MKCSWVVSGLVFLIFGSTALWGQGPEPSANPIVGAWQQNMERVTNVLVFGKQVGPISHRGFLLCLTCMTDQKFEWAKLQAQLDELRAHISELLKKLESAVGKEAEALRPKLKAAQERLNELKDTSAEAWEDLKPGLRKSWEELHKSLNQAASRFKTPRPKQ